MELVPLIGSVLESLVIVLEYPAMLVSELVTQTSPGNGVLIRESLELSVGGVLLVHGTLEFHLGSLNFFHQDLEVLADEWSVNWMVLEGLGGLGNLHQLIVDSLGLGGVHTDGPEVGSSSGLVVSLASGASLELLKSVIDLVSDGLELLVIVVKVSSSNEVVEGSLGLSIKSVVSPLELSIVVHLLLLPCLKVWLEVLVDELLSVSASLQQLTLNLFGGGSINDVVLVWCGGDQGDEGSVFHIFIFFCLIYYKKITIKNLNQKLLDMDGDVI
jgi:hypothetical protein